MAYVNSVKDHQQYPAARVAHGARFEGETIYMYQRSSSSTAESMNTANKSVWDRAAVDLINALILLLKLEAKRYAENKEKAWEWTEVLTPHGQKLLTNAFKSINPRDYTISIESKEYKYECTVTSNKTGNTYFCWFPRTYDDDNFLFGGCSCGAPNTDSIPCIHMCVVVKSYRIEGLTKTNIMPIWWHKFHWRKQYPADSVVWSTVGIESIRNAAASAKTNDLDFKLCPPYSAGRKGGRPREEKQIEACPANGNVVTPFFNATFLDRLLSHCNADLSVDSNGEWIGDSAIHGNLRIAHDGSYMANKLQFLCSTGVIFYCRCTKLWLKVSITELSDAASN